ncbi:hypothetical protein PSENEW3_00000361 [Picochlorum sp. SENEW3]|nr:hypothetical protein PSENEW3_00000361 [Picochlorum sp. SENEW3]
MAASKTAIGYARALVLGRSSVFAFPCSVHDVIQHAGNGLHHEKGYLNRSFSSSRKSSDGEENSPSTSNKSKEIHPPSSSSSSAAAVYEYHGPFSAAVNKVKKLSLFSCACAVGAGPVMLLLDGGTSLSAKMGLAGTLSAFGLTTTGLLHWFTHPYVHKLSVGGDRELKIETLNFFAKPVLDVVQLDSVEGGAENSMHPLSTFMANKKVFYIDKDFFADKDVLDILDPPSKEEEEEEEEEEEVDEQDSSGGGEPSLDKK